MLKCPKNLFEISYTQNPKKTTCVVTSETCFLYAHPAPELGHHLNESPLLYVQSHAEEQIPITAKRNGKRRKRKEPKKKLIQGELSLAPKHFHRRGGNFSL
jgi:hypothetical protein